ncbi:MAG: DUF4215 domain-containing protein [Myxococcota bacterium]
MKYPVVSALPIRVFLCVLAVAFMVGMDDCDSPPPPPPPSITITSPANGAILEGPTVTVQGTTNRSFTVLVNGVVAPISSMATWEATIPLDTDGVITPIDAELIAGNGLPVAKSRITVLAGASLGETEFATEAVALGFTNSGLDSLLPLVSTLAGDALDISSLLLTGGTIFDDQIFTFDVSASAYDADIGSFSIDASSSTDQVDTRITIDGLSIAANVDIEDGLAIDWSCKVEVDMTSATIDAAFDLGPDATIPTRVDVNQIGDVDVTVEGLSFQFIDGPCDPDAPLIGPLINILVGDQLNGAIPSGFRESLKDPDGAGPLDSPIALGIQEALAGIDIAGEVGGAVGVALDAPINAINEDDNGVTLNADALFAVSTGTGPGQCEPPATAPDLGPSYRVASGSPSFGPTAPGGNPYSLGLGISSSSFNQLFKGMVECGLLSLDVTEAEFAGNTVPVTTGLFSLLGMPEFEQVIGPQQPLTIRIQPVMAPFLTGNPGPSGEMVELGLPYLLMNVVNPVDDMVWLVIAIDTRFGLDLAFDPVAAQLAPVVSAPLPGASIVRVIDNAILTNEAVVESAIQLILPSFFSSFGDAFGSFPLPTFFGLQLDVVEVEAADGLFKLYSNLNQSPTTRVENVVLTDLSTTDFVTDGVFDTNEWRHRTKLTATGSAIDTRYRALIAGDACCTVDDETVTATADYLLDFDVVPLDGETWQLDIAHTIIGALTTVDEANALYDGSELAEFTTAIQGRYSIDGGPFVPFDFGPNPASVFDGFGGAEDNLNAEVTGMNSVRLFGTTSQHITLQFSWGMRVFSDSNAITPAIDGGEGAIRLGMHDTIELGTAPSAGFTAGHYPGQGNRDISADGHFVDVDLTAIPCVGDPAACPVCGDGAVAGSEACDDGNGMDGDGCGRACELEAGFVCTGSPSSCVPICGDGAVLGIEGCDDGNTGGGDGCSMLCQVEAGWGCAGEPSVCGTTCGDGIPVGAEPCDDGNVNYGDGCRPNCTAEVCGDTIVDPGEVCDDGNTSGGDGCSANCTGLDDGCQVGQNSCFTYNSGFSFGRDCRTRTLCIGSPGWYLLEGDTNGTNIGDFDISGQPHNLNNIETAQTRSDYNFLPAGTYTIEACDETGLGLGNLVTCVRPADRVSAPGSVSGGISDSPDLDSGTGEIDLAGPISGGDHCYVVDVLETGSYRIVANHNSGGGLLAAGLYSGTPPSGLMTAAGQSPSPIAVGDMGTSGFVTLNAGTVYHLCADTATLGSGINFTLTLEAQ